MLEKYQAQLENEDEISEYTYDENEEVEQRSLPHRKKIKYLQFEFKWTLIGLIFYYILIYGAFLANIYYSVEEIRAVNNVKYPLEIYGIELIKN